MKSPDLDLNPSYQRELVWTSDRMTKLIDSFMCDFYIPPLIFNVTETATVENGVKKYMRRSIDGKQRLTSVREFVAGKIPCHDAKGKRWFFCEDADRTTKAVRKILPPHEKRKFLRKELLCVEYNGLEKQQEEDLFSRVQLGMPLTPAEKLRASSGLWQDFAIELGDEFKELIQGVVDDKRARGFQLVLQVFKQLLKGDTNDLEPKYAAGAVALKGFCSDTAFLTNDFKESARTVFNRYLEVFVQFPETFHDHGYKHATKFSPVEFVGVAILIHRFPNRNARLLSGDIIELRRELRGKRQELRSNTDTWKSLVESILSIEESRGAVEPVGPNHIFGSAEQGAMSFAAAPPIVGSGSPISSIDAAGRTPIAARQRTRPPNRNQSKNDLVAVRTPKPLPPPPVNTRRRASKYQQQQQEEEARTYLNQHNSQPPMLRTAMYSGSNNGFSPANNEYEARFHAIRRDSSKRLRPDENDTERTDTVKKEKIGPYIID